MRKPDLETAVIVGTALIGVMLCVYMSLLAPAENPHANLWKNPYWPFTVELSVRDR